MTAGAIVAVICPMLPEKWQVGCGVLAKVISILGGGL